MSETDDIQIDPAICGGKPVLRGTRVAVSIVLGSLAAGMSLQEVADEYGITDAQIRAALILAIMMTLTTMVVLSGGFSAGAGVACKAKCSSGRSNGVVGAVVLMTGVSKNLPIVRDGLHNADRRLMPRRVA